MTSFSHEFNHFPSRWLAAGLITETFQAIAHYGESTEMGLELQRLVPGNYFIFWGGRGICLQRSFKLQLQNILQAPLFYMESV